MVRLHREIGGGNGTVRVLSNQLLHSGTAIGANLEEGKGGHSRPDFIAKYTIALKEARETHYWLRLLAACDLVPARRIDPLVGEANEIVAVITTIVKNAKGGRKPDSDEEQEVEGGSDS
jgi:four helix bundle protein